MAATDLVKEEIFNFGVVGPKDKVNWSFEFKDNSKIQYISLGCGCTKIEKWDGKRLSGVLDINLAGQYESGMNSVNKVVTVYINDGEEHFIAGDNFRLVPNPKKKIERLTITGIVKK